MQTVDIFVFHRDLRVNDNKAWNSLIRHSDNSIIPIFIFNPKQIYAKKNSYFSNNAVQFMIESLEDLEKNLYINYYEGNDIEILEKIKKNYKISSIAFNKDYTPFAIRRDKIIEDWCNKNGINLIIEEDYTLFQIGKIRNNNGNSYQKFTPFYKTAIQMSKAIEEPKTVSYNNNIIKTVLKYDKHKYYKKNENIELQGGRIYGLERLKKDMTYYEKERDIPYLESTTKLSPYIKFGCISIREVYYNYSKNTTLIKELIWREFYANIIYEYPHVIGGSFKKKYDKIKWSNDKANFRKWCNGETGYPIIDAGMKQLNEIGWMHNRVRMIVATFLVKDLMIDWRWGEKYFATKLVDYDPASNNGGWQWCASTGTDSQPYFRIFNPFLQAKKYDKNNEYIKKWNPDYNNKEQIIEHSKAIKRKKP